MSGCRGARHNQNQRTRRLSAVAPMSIRVHPQHTFTRRHAGVRSFSWSAQRRRRRPCSSEYPDDPTHGPPNKMLPVAPTAKQTPAAPRARSKRGEIVMVTSVSSRPCHRSRRCSQGPTGFLRMRSLTVGSSVASAFSAVVPSPCRSAVAVQGRPGRSSASS